MERHRCCIRNLRKGRQDRSPFYSRRPEGAGREVPSGLLAGKVGISPGMQLMDSFRQTPATAVANGETLFTWLCSESSCAGTQCRLSRIGRAPRTLSCSTRRLPMNPVPRNRRHAAPEKCAGFPDESRHRLRRLSIFSSGSYRVSVAQSFALQVPLKH